MRAGRFILLGIAGLVLLNALLGWAVLDLLGFI